MKRFSSEGPIELVDIQPCSLIDGCFRIKYPSGELSNTMNKRMVDAYFFEERNDAIKMHNSRIEHCIKYHEEEIQTLKKSLL